MIVIVVLSVLVIPFPSVIVTVKIVVVDTVAVGLAIVGELNPVVGVQEYKTVPSAVTFVDKATGTFGHTVTLPPVIKTVGSSSSIPVNAETWPSVREALFAISVSDPKFENLIQGFVAWLNEPLSCAEDIFVSVPLISAIT